MRHSDLGEIGDCISSFYDIVKEEYILGIRGREIFDTSDREYAALYAVTGVKRKRPGDE